MNLDQDIQGDVTILRPWGRLDSTTSPQLETAVIERIDTGCTRLVFDLAETEYVSSAGLRVILMAAKRLQGRQHRVVLAGLRDNVRDVFEVSGFLGLFPVASDVHEALAGG